MILIDYTPDLLPKTVDMVYITIPYVDEDFSLDWIEERGHVACVIPCVDGLVIVLRTDWKACEPFIVLTK